MPAGQGRDGCGAFLRPLNAPFLFTAETERTGLGCPITAAARFSVPSWGTLPWHLLALDLLPGPQDLAQGFIQEVAVATNADIAGQVPA